MPLQDTWFRKDGTPTVSYHTGRNRWRIRHNGRSQSFPDIERKKAPAPGDKPPKTVEVAWARMLTEKPRQVEDVLVGELIDRWLATKRGLSPRGYRACLDASGHVRKEWGGRVAAGITREQVQVWFAGMEWSPSMRHKLFQCLAGSLELTGQPNPCKGLYKTLPKEKRRESGWFAVDDLAKLAQECHGYEAMIWTLATTGMRIGEVCALNVGDVVDVGTKSSPRMRLRVRESKNGQGRDVGIPPKVLAMLDLSRPKSAPLFTSGNGHRVLKDNFRARHFKPAAARAGFPNLRIHDLRHAMASLAISLGADVTDVAHQLGNDKAVTLGVYTERWDPGVDEVAKRMDDLVPDKGDNE